MTQKEIGQETIKHLFEEACQARRNSYAPYSDFHVGAALLCADGSIIRGCNIENASYSPTNCAERTAFFTAVAEGKREFSAIGIVGGAGEEIRPFCTPCGVCLQVMAEFCDAKSFEIYAFDAKGNAKRWTLLELLPNAFHLDD